jgi:hypothetical protein
MAEDTKENFKGRLDHIISKTYVDGIVTKTEFQLHIPLEDQEFESRDMNFPGLIPREYVGRIVEYDAVIRTGAFNPSVYSIKTCVPESPQGTLPPEVPLKIEVIIPGYKPHI